MLSDLYEIVPCTEEDVSLINEKIGAYAYAVAPPEPGMPGQARLVFRAEDANGCFAGGCVVNIHEWGRAVLALLWVDEAYRGHGLGSVLIQRAERAAREKGCRFMCLGTMDFMARGFYEKHGYTVFTVNKDFPRGHEGWSLSKRIDRETPDYVPTDNSAVTLFTVKPGSEADAKRIDEGLERYNRPFAPKAHDEISICRKLTDQNGNTVACVIAEVGGWDECDIDGIWVEEPYRGRGLGAYLLRAVEREAKENGAYILFTYGCDWVVGFFRKQGYTVRGTLADYPKGHNSYELQKLL